MPSVSEQAIDLSLNFPTQHSVRPKFPALDISLVLTLRSLLSADHDDLSTNLKLFKAKEVGDDRALCTALPALRRTGTVQVLAQPMRRRRRALLYASRDRADWACVEQVFMEVPTRRQAHTISSRHFPSR